MILRARSTLRACVVAAATCGAACGSDAPAPPPEPTPGCPAGYRECDGDPGTVCETLIDDPAHCGACDVVCPPGGARQVPACSAGSCVLACEAGFADCNGGGEDGCETETDSSSASCGGCDVACAQDEACKFGSCRPIPFAVVANLPNRPWPIAVDDEFVYWGLRGSPNAGAVQRAPKGGGAVTTLVAGQADVQALAIDGADVYWTSGTTLRRAPKSSVMGAADELATGFEVGSYPCLTVDEEFVYWCARDDVLRLPTDGSATEPTVLASLPGGAGGALGGLAVDASHLYIAQINSGTAGVTGAIWRVDRAAAGPRPPLELIAARQRSPVGIATDATAVYWCNVDSVVARRKDLGEPALVLAAVPALVEYPLFVAADGLDAYFTNESTMQTAGSLVQSVRVDATQLTTIASEPNGPGQITVDASYAYWTTSGTEGNGIWTGGAVYRIAK